MTFRTTGGVTPQSTWPRFGVSFLDMATAMTKYEGSVKTAPTARGLTTVPSVSKICGCFRGAEMTPTKYETLMNPCSVPTSPMKTGRKASGSAAVTSAREEALRAERHATKNAHVPVT